jgi:hypothetical protein
MSWIVDAPTRAGAKRWIDTWVPQPQTVDNIEVSLSSQLSGDVVLLRLT